LAQAPGVGDRPAPGGEAFQAAHPRDLPERHRVRAAHLRGGSGGATVLPQARRLADGDGGGHARRRHPVSADLRPGAPPRSRGEAGAAYPPVDGKNLGASGLRAAPNRPSPAILSRNSKREVPKVIRRTLGVLLVAGLAVSCSRKPASIEVSPRPVKMFGLGRTTRLTGRALDKKGRPVEGIAIAWQSSKPEVVNVDSSGKLESKAEGKSIVTASFQKLSMQVPVEVLDFKTIEIAPMTAHLVGPVGTAMSLTTTLKNSRGAAVTGPVA